MRRSEAKPSRAAVEAPGHSPPAAGGAPTEPLRLGIVGCGRIASLGYVPALAAMPGLRLAAVADPCDLRSRALAAASGAEPELHAGPAELIASSGVDALIVASPAELHLEHARLAAEAGLPCLVEKPPAPGLATARELAALEPMPWIGFNRRFWQGRELAGRVPATGPLELELELRYRRSAWRSHSSRDDALLDLGPHLIDLALALAGTATARVRSARCAAQRAELELHTERGPALIRCATDRPHLERVVARTAAGRVESRSGGLVRGAAARLARRPHPLVASLRLQLGAFAAAVRGGDPGPLATAADGVATMAVLDAARRPAHARSPRSAALPARPRA